MSTNEAHTEKEKKVNQFFCPGDHCHADLVVDGKITLGVLNPVNFTRGILRASPIVGDYEITKSSSLIWTDGDRLDIICPCCGRLLNSDDQLWAKIVMKTADGKEFKIVFSTIVGQKATYKITPKRKIPFGSDVKALKKPNWESLMVSC